MNKDDVINAYFKGNGEVETNGHGEDMEEQQPMQTNSKVIK